MKTSGTYIWTDEKVREAKRDYCEAFWWVHHQFNPEDSVEEFCTKCGGHNCDTLFFDLNYKHVCITVGFFDNKTMRVHKNFEYWPDPETMVYVDCNIDEFVDY